ncbi:MULTISPECIES: class I SAM-dependent DNA methyltransferase [unclassified Pasteurella]|uniref:type I restriction-modification system subunit M n=1 Tax=unclassified Pasteurella TaxID=2621516 RepID=UPI001074615C|nr:SAM-dependent DNA methyltransferase [Pasteurella sp. 19428wF3_WM03]TFU51956.1 SAM-dependent DNA methyltransferase [Pasteurella sp. WM03]
MDHSVHNKLVSFIWSIADDCLRDVYVRGKYRDVILPMFVLRRLDTLLEPNKGAVLEEVHYQKEELGFTELDHLQLEKTSGYVFYNTSKWTLKTLYQTASNTPQYMLANFEEYLDGFSANVQEIINCFKLREQIRHMSNKNVLLGVLEKFVSPYINLTPNPQQDPDGNTLPALTNLGMGYVFEELIRKFNEENNEEAGEHFTPREVIELMTHLVFDPLKRQIPAIITIYDPACGSGGMLTESQNFIEEKYPLSSSQGDRSILLFGKEINDETYAICKSDMLIKGDNPENIKVGSTLATDTFHGHYFDFMLSNPPYGKSWSGDQAFIKDGNGVIDSRFKVSLPDYWGKEESLDATPRSSDGQLLFLMEMVSKMKSPKDNKIGSRVASVHNGSSLFTGDAGSGESNIRRFIIENDLLDAIVQLPNNLFYNTGITTYIWLLSNNKPAHRQGKVQLIDASSLFRKLRKNLGDKNCEFAPEHITEITKTYLNFTALSRRNNEEGLASQIFDNQDFGYYKVTIERPERRSAKFTAENIATLRFDKALFEPMQYLYQQYGENIYNQTTLTSAEQDITAWCEAQGIALNNKAKAKLLDVKTWEKSTALFNTANKLFAHFGEQQFDDFNLFKQTVEKYLKAEKISLSATEKKAIFNAVSWYNENAEKVIAKTLKLKPQELEALCKRLDCKIEELADFGYYATEKIGEFIQYESASELRDSESIPLKQSIHHYFKTEVQPHVSEAWVNLDSIKIGYEISFNKYFYRHKPLRSLSEVAQDILALERQTDGLICEILG